MDTGCLATKLGPPQGIKAARKHKAAVSPRAEHTRPLQIYMSAKKLGVDIL